MVKNYHKSVVYNPGSRKEKPPRVKTSLPWFYIILIVISVALGFGFLVLQAEISAVSFEIETLQREINSLENDNRDLRLQLAGKTNLRQIEKRARQDLAMVQPQQQEYLVLTPPEPRLAEKGEELPTRSFEVNFAGFFGDLAQWVSDQATVAAGALGE